MEKTRSKLCFLAIRRLPYTHDFMVACIRPIQNSARKYSTMENVEFHTSTSLTKELQTVDAFCGRNSQFALRVQLLEVKCVPVEGPYPCLFGQHKPTQCVIKHKRSTKFYHKSLKIGQQFQQHENVLNQFTEINSLFI